MFVLVVLVVLIYVVQGNDGGCGKNECRYLALYVLYRMLITSSKRGKGRWSKTVNPTQ